MLAVGAVSLSTNQILWLGGGALAGYALMLWSNPVRASFLDGARTVRRYPRIWLLLGGLGFANAAFDLSVRAYLHFAAPAGMRPEFRWVGEAWHDPDVWLTGSPESVWWLPRADFTDAVRSSVLPAFESLAGLFNCLVSTFPFSVIAALLLFFNWERHRSTLFAALRKRFGTAGLAIHAGILICALAAILKPAYLMTIPWIEDPRWLQWEPALAWLAFIFEYLLGLCLQVYLILLAYVWVRGLNFDHQHLLDMAIRRFSFVVKWGVIVLLLSTLFIDLPLMLRSFARFSGWLPAPDVFATRLVVARSAVALFVLLGAGMQITLTFHSESWRKALRDHLHFLLRFPWRFSWFLIVAAAHFFAAHAFNQCLARGLGEGTALWVAWRLCAPWLIGAVGAWLLASWVCFFKQSEAARALDPEPIRF